MSETVNTARGDRWSTWLTVWTCLCLPAYVYALLMWGGQRAFYITVAITFCVTLILIGVRRSGAERRSLRSRIRLIIRASLCATSSFLAMAMVSEVAGALWLLMPAAMASTTPPALRALKAAARRFGDIDEKATPDEVRPARLPSRQDLQEMTNIELCWQWRSSFWALADTRSAEVRSSLVIHRREILDELTRRDSAAVEAWLASGARASSSPEKFFGDDSGQPAAA